MTYNVGIYQVRSFDNFGCALDGVTADSANAQLALNWLAAGPYRELVLPQGKTLRVNSPLVLDCAKQTGCRLDLVGPMMPDNGIGDMLTINNTEFGIFNLFCAGNGSAYTDANYLVADPVGGQQAFVVQGCRSCKFDVRVRAYNGRAFRTKLETGTQIKSSFHDVTIMCEDGTGGQVSQAFYMQGSTAWGTLVRTYHPTYDYASIFDTVTDFTIDDVQGPPLEFRGCTSGWIDSLSLGNASGTGTGLKFTTNGSGVGCGRISVDKVLVVGLAIGVHCDHNAASANGINFAYIYTTSCTDTGLLIDNSDRVKAKVSSNLDMHAVRIVGSGSNNIGLDLEVRASVKQAVIKDNTVAHLVITGCINSCATDGTTACMTLSGTNSGIIVRDLLFSSATGTAIFELDPSNLVEISGGLYGGSVATFATNAPKTTNIGGIINSASIGQTTPAAGSFTTLSTGSNLANYLTFAGAATANNPAITVAGSDTSPGITFATKSGIGFNILDLGGGTNVNYMQVRNSATTSPPSIMAVGTDTNIGLKYITKGTGTHFFQSAGGTSIAQITSAGAASFSGSLTVAAGAIIGAGAVAAVGIDLGSTGTAATSYVDLHSSGNNIDYDVRIASTGGSGSTGQGSLVFTAANIVMGSATTPATAGASGQAGTVTWDSGFLYVCTATNTWKRVAIAIW